MTRQEADRLKIGDRVRVTDLLGTSGDDDAQTGTVVENVPGLGRVDKSVDAGIVN
jgi:hypothetical protein